MNGVVPEHLGAKMIELRMNFWYFPFSQKTQKIGIRMQLPSLLVKRNEG
jgi:hypothetical protein